MSIPRMPFALDAAGHERHMVRDRADVVADFARLAAARARATLYFGENDMLHTELLSANPAFEELLFAPGEDAALTARLLAAGECGVETTLDGVRVLFSSRHVEAVELNGVRGLRLRMPESLAQLQRRGAQRLATPAEDPPWCALNLDDREHAATRLRVTDISAGGIALALSPGDPALRAGQHIEQCTLEIPGVGGLRCALLVVYLYGVDDAGSHKAGCKFTDLPELSRRQVEDYMARLQRHARA